MTTRTPSTLRRPAGSSRPVLLLGGGLIAIAALAFSALAFAAPPAKHGVTVSIDNTPITRTAPSQTESYAPIVKKVVPSVVKVLVTERAKNVPMSGNPFFNDPHFRFFFGPSFGGDSFGGDDDDDNDNGDMPPREMPPRHHHGYFNGPTQHIPEQDGLGSGVIVSTDGYVLTNAHVVNGADDIKVSLNDGRELKAKVVGVDAKTDLAVIKIDATNLPAATFADSDQTEVGDRVLAIGNPFGVGETVTSGIVSGLGRGIGILADVQGYEDFIQTDASINPGNSGGALTDVLGRVIGINTAILSRTGGFQGIGLAIPSNLARDVMEQLITNGKVVRGYLGVTVQDLTPFLADQFGIKNNQGGALVAEVNPTSPADKSGLKSGDVITAFDGKPVKDGRALQFAVADAKPGATVTTTIVRNNKEQKISITIGNQPSDRNGGSGDDNAQGGDNGTLSGVGVADLDGNARRHFGIPDNITGALITEVDPDSASAEAGLSVGSVIEEINRQPVKNADDAIRLTANPPSKKTLLRIWDQGHTSYIVVDETDTSSAADDNSGK